MTQTPKPLQFPTEKTGFMSLAEYKLNHGEYPDAVKFAYAAMKNGEQSEKCTVIIARALLLSGNPDEALRFIFAEYPDTENRPQKILEIMRDAFRDSYEHTQERRVMLELHDMGAKPQELDIPEDLDYALSEYDVILNDTLFYGVDSSAADADWITVRPVTGMSVALSSVRLFHDGLTSALRRRMRHAIQSAVSEEISIPTGFVLQSAGNFMSASVFDDDSDGALYFLETITGDTPIHSVSNMCSVALIAYLSTKDEKLLETIDSVPLPAPHELSCVAHINLFLERNEAAYKLFKQELKVSPYAVGLNRKAAFAGYTLGKYGECYECYDKMAKLLPWDKAVEYYKQHCLIRSSKNPNSINPDPKDFHMPFDCHNRISAAVYYTDKMQAILDNAADNPDADLSLDDEDMLSTFIPMLKNSMQCDVIKLFAEKKSDRASHLIRRLLLDKVTDRSAKDLALRTLMHHGAQKRIACCCEGSFIEAYPLMHTDFETYPEMYEAYKKCYNTAKRSYNMMCALALNSYYEYYMRVCSGFAALDAEDAEALAAKMLIMAALRCGCDNPETVLNTYYPDVNDDDLMDITEYLDICERGYIDDIYCNM
ncbi:MAG: hypothetical protein IJO93_04385 [Clostridia bacterium]|nr:hypothetical protein [Clostridia bacterium]